MGGGVPERRIIVIPNGIDVDAFSPDPEGRARLRKEWGVSPEEPLIGIVGRVHPIKDHKSFLQAALLLLQEEPSFKFVVVGEGVPEYESELKMFAKQMNVEDRVIWAGVRSDLRSVYSSLDVLCSSSYSEGFSNVIGEAMACGVPCAVTDVGDSARIVGEFGTVCPPGDAPRLAAAIGEVLNLGRRDACLGEKCRQRIRQEFSVERLVLATEQALRSVRRPARQSGNTEYRDSGEGK